MAGRDQPNIQRQLVQLNIARAVGVQIGQDAALGRGAIHATTSDNTAGDIGPHLSTGCQHKVTRAVEVDQTVLADQALHQ